MAAAMFSIHIGKHVLTGQIIVILDQTKLQRKNKFVRKMASSVSNGQSTLLHCLSINSENKSPGVLRVFNTEIAILFGFLFNYSFNYSIPLLHISLT